MYCNSEKYIHIKTELCTLNERENKLLLLLLLWDISHIKHAK